MFQQDIRKQEQLEDQKKNPPVNVLDRPVDEAEQKQGNEQIVSTRLHNEWDSLSFVRPLMNCLNMTYKVDWVLKHSYLLTIL